MSNQVCGNCGHTNRPGVLFCENCGTSLTGKAAVGATKSFEEESAQAATREQVSSAGTDYFLANSTLRIEIEGGPEPILIKPKQELIFGRRDPATGAMPDIDLTPYAGYRMGVSRRHAAIRTADDNHLDVWDLGSSNGTFLNGQRLKSHRPYRLRDGDRLRLGQMIIRVLFQPPEEAAAESTESAATAAATATAGATATTAEGASAENKPHTHVPGSHPVVPASATASGKPMPPDDLLKTKKVKRDVVKAAVPSGADAVASPAVPAPPAEAPAAEAPAATEAPAAAASPPAAVEAPAEPEAPAAAETPAESTSATEAPAAAETSAAAEIPAEPEAPAAPESTSAAEAPAATETATEEKKPADPPAGSSEGAG